MSSNANLVAARLYWQLGSWDKLAKVAVSIPGSGKVSDDDVELALFKSQALFQVGETEAASDLIRSLDVAGVSRNLIRDSLWGGAQNALARGWILAGNRLKAKEAIGNAIMVHEKQGDPDLVAELRYSHERAALGKGLSDCEKYGRKLFLDCGGFDGCSALMFLLSNPEFDCMSFEPNPEMWKYFEGIPTTLVKKAVYIYDGEIDFTIDPVDGDGSTLVSGKRIDFTKSVPDADCPVLSVPCVDLSRIIKEASDQYDYIALKLDVEGAEYDILEKIMEDGTISMIDAFYCEFHAHKMEIEDGRHERIFAKVQSYVETEEWDALPLSFSLKETPGLKDKKRAALIEAIEKNRKKVSLY